MTPPERQYGDYIVSHMCFEGNHGDCRDRTCQCHCHPLTLRERIRIARAGIRRQFKR